MSSHVIGTAGHIDHGKSTLIHALTGIDPDRLKEEKEREMTIDLGFAYVYLPSGKKIGIVDVPGHEKFIRNMLSGATGIDLVLFVVAADEGVMPQTKEHLEILNFLEIQKGIIVLTKMDLVDEEWLSMMVQDIEKAVTGTFLENAPILPVSSRIGDGLEKLLEKIDELLIEIPPRDSLSPVRFPIDRSFTISGFGTVVTGTLWEGQVKKGQSLKVLPLQREVRVRSIQNHKEEVSQGDAGMRLALNITAVSKDEIKRGFTLVDKNFFEVTKMISVSLKLSKDTFKLRHGEKVHFFLGTGEVVGKIRFLDREELKPGEKTFAQIKLEKPIVAKHGDNFVIRRYSPVITIGGGKVIDVYAGRKKRYEQKNIDNLRKKERGDLEEYLNKILEEKGIKGAGIDELKVIMATLEGVIHELLDKSIRKGQTIKAEGIYFSRGAYLGLKKKILTQIEMFYKYNPMSSGILKEELR
ncbi:MAG: selenocysteine-specific translation elongation factor, partial [Actinomycetia bacterium]|nr:selenocysteine-specific translation elongation factor [Actinomycetes bacterium]